MTETMSLPVGDKLQYAYPGQGLLFTSLETATLLAFFINLQQAFIGPSATLTGR